MGEFLRGQARSLGALLLALSIFGCTSVYPPEKADLSALQSNGMLVLSTRGTELCGPSLTLHFWSNNGTSTFVNVNNTGLKSDFADHTGIVDALTLKPGRYDMFPDAQGGTLTHVPHAFIVVEAGKVVYIGEYFASAPCLSRWEWQSRIDSYFVDEFERDVAVLKAKNPAFDKVAIEKHIVHFEVVTPN